MIIAAQGAEKPVTTPAGLIIAHVEVVLHEPVGVGSARTVAFPWQTARFPIIGAGAGFTVTVEVV